MREVRPHLQYILDDLAVLRGRLPTDKQQFLDDDLLQDAILMRFIDIGEQLVRIRDKFPDVYHDEATEDWHKLIGLRNVITHGYHEVNLDTVWDIVRSKLDGFESQLRSLAEV